MQIQITQDSQQEPVPDFDPSRTPDAGSPADGVLWVNCAKGKTPEAEPNDGVRLDISRGPAFDEQVRGRAVFLLQRPMPNLAWKRAGGT